MARLPCDGGRRRRRSCVVRAESPDMQALVAIETRGLKNPRYEDEDEGEDEGPVHGAREARGALLRVEREERGGLLCMEGCDARAALLCVEREMRGALLCMEGEARSGAGTHMLPWLRSIMSRWRLTAPNFDR